MPLFHTCICNVYACMCFSLFLPVNILVGFYCSWLRTANGLKVVVKELEMEIGYVCTNVYVCFSVFTCEYFDG